MLRKIIIALVLWTIPAFVFTQNLVPNGDFEKLETGKQTWELKDHYEDNVNAASWTDGPGWRHTVCSCRNKITDQMVLDGVCNTNLIKPNGSCQIIQMYVNDGAYKERYKPPFRFSNTSFLHTELKQNLQVGKFYEVSISVYFPERKFFHEEIFNQFGLKLLNKPIKSYNVGLFKSKNHLRAENIQKDNWQTLKWKIRPLCNIAHLTIGVFVDNTWVFENRAWHSYKYFIDNVSVVEVEPESKEEFEYYECVEFPEQITKYYSGSDSTYVYFENNSFEINEKSRMSIQGIADTLKKYPYLVLNVEAGADSKGSDNALLSSNRLEAVTNYLIEELNISKDKIIGRAISDSLAKVAIGDGRSNWKYRSALLSISNILSPQKIYRELIKSCQSSDKNAFGRYFKIWSRIAEKDDLMHILFDPRLQECMPEWVEAELMSLLETQHDSNVDFKEAFFLDSLYIMDQKIRSHSYKLKLLTGTHEFDDNIPFSIPEDYISSSTDSTNLIAIIKYLEEHDIPGYSKYGKHASRLVPLIINHTMDTTLYAQFLPRFKEQCLKGEMEWIQYINLYDRYLKLSGKPQEYGTQWVNRDESSVVLYDHIEAEKLNAKREEIGLQPIDVNRVIYFRQ